MNRSEISLDFFRLCVEDYKRKVQILVIAGRGFSETVKDNKSSLL